METFPPLYKSQKNRVRVWQISVEENDEGEGIIIVYFGLQGGKMTPKVTIVSKGKNIGKKNETTPYEQALSQATSLWEDQINNGGYHEDISKINQVAMNVMLAYDFRKYKHKISYPAYGQPKLDGCRAHIFLDENGDIIMLTRENKRIVSMEHIRQEFKKSKFFEKYPSVHLDSELYCHGMPLQKIIGLVNTDVNIEDLDQEELRKINCYIFDCFDANKLDLSFSQRFKIPFSYFKNKKTTYIYILQTIILKDEEMVYKKNEEFYKQEYEGIMVRNDNAPYKFSKGKAGRSSDLLKYKTFEQDNYIIVNMIEAENKPGTPIFVCETIDKKEFNVNASGTFDYQRELWLERKKYIGKKIRIKFFGKTLLGVPKFAQTVLGPDGRIIIVPDS